MATQTGTTSRLGQMQMRFQAKIQKETDQKRNELNSPGSVGGVGGGKVRQLFEERRRGIGIDKSYPLQPINSTTMTTTTTTKRSTMMDSGRPSLLGHRSTQQPVTSSTTRTTTRTLPGGRGAGQITTTTSISRSSNSSLSSPSSKYDTNNNFDATDFGEAPQPATRYRGGLSGKLAGLSISSEINNNTAGGSLRLKPVNSPLSASSANSTRAVANGPVLGKRTINTTTSSLSSNGDSSLSSRASPVMSSSGSAARSPTKAVGGGVKATTPVRKPSGPPPDNMAECSICGRYFNKDRIEKHETICEKSKSKKRKVFDATKHRVKGTDAESYVAKKGRVGAGGHRTVAGVVVKTEAKKGNWRKKHEEFIAAIRAAKEMQAYVAKGGKLSDLPPPPPSENADYIQCPHCSRRFNEGAATRHIPKCATMLHNKPKPAPAKRRF